MVAVRVDPTPNPNSLKFTASSTLSPKPVTYASAEAAAADPLAAKLFAVPGVKSVFVLNNFVTVTKDPAVDWGAMADQLARIVGDHLGT